MQRTKPLLFATAFAVSSVFCAAALAQAAPQQHTMATSATPVLSDGEVRKIDKETGKITLRHGEIKHLDMPPMTMVFVAKDKSLLDKLKTGDKVRFMTVHENGQMIITELQPR